MRHLQQAKELEVRINELQKEKEVAIKTEAEKLETTKRALLDSETRRGELGRKLSVAYQEVQCMNWLIG